MRIRSAVRSSSNTLRSLDGRHLVRHRTLDVSEDERRGRIDGTARPRDRHLVDGQSLPTLGAATLENDAAVLGPHPHQKPMGATAAAAIRLKSTFHGTPSLASKRPEETRIVAPGEKECQFASYRRCQGRGAVVESRAFRRGTAPGEFSTPVEKPVEILGFLRDPRLNPHENGSSTRASLGRFGPVFACFGGMA